MNGYTRNITANFIKWLSQKEPQKSYQEYYKECEPQEMWENWKKAQKQFNDNLDINIYTNNVEAWVNRNLPRRMPDELYEAYTVWRKHDMSYD